MTRVVHLEQRIGTLCDSEAVHRWSTPHLDLVSCTRCLRRIETLNHDGWSDALERRHAERTRAAAEAVGLDSVLDFLATQDDHASAYVQMVSGIVGSIAVYLQEQGYVAPADQDAAA